MKQYIQISKNDYCQTLREADPNERYDGDDICHNHVIHGFYSVKEKECWDFVLDVEELHSRLYLVYVLYDTGDSFHSEENCIELIGVYSNIEDVLVIEEAIELDHRKYKKTKEHDYNPMKVLLPKSNKIQEISTCTWKGYFETFNTVETKTIKLLE